MVPNIVVAAPGEFGWLRRPDEVEKAMATMPIAKMKGAILSAAGDKNVLLYQAFRKVAGTDAPKGPQAIGDCVSWGWSNFGNYLQALQILDMVHVAGLLGKVMDSPYTLQDHPDSAIADMRAAGKFQLKLLASEAMYGFSRVTIGGQRGSYQDGSVGAWAAKAATDCGFVTREAVGTYSGDRAKDWGAKGVPQQFLADAKLHCCKVTSQVGSADEAIATLEQVYTPIPVCSDQGFTMTRDAQGFCQPSGTWNHCMLIVAYRADRPGFLISQSWGPNTPQGPLALDQPDNTFWADANVVDRMLRQGDSFTGNTLPMYVKRNYIDWGM